MYIKKNTRKKDGKTYNAYYLAQGYRDKKTGKVKHKYLSNISSLSEEHISVLRAMLKGEEVHMKSIDDFEIVGDKEYGSVAVFGKLFDENFKGILDEKYYKELKALVINRIFEPKSKIGLKNWIKQVSLPEIKNKNNIYESVNYLEEHQDTIEKQLFKKQGSSNCDLLLYDITSTYFEGDKCDIAKYGYSRDHRGDKKQINIGLVTDNQGCPITTEIIEGNIVDKTTVKDKVDALQKRFGIKNITFVFDRGMKTKVNLNYIQEQGFDYITALNHSELKKRAEGNKEIKRSLFEKENLAEFVIDEKKYILSYNAPKAYKDTEDRLLLIEKTEKELQKIQNLKRDYTTEQLQDKISKKINKYKCEKYFNYTIEITTKNKQEKQNGKSKKVEKEFGRFIFNRNQEKITYDQKYDGFYMVESTKTEEKGEVLEKKYKSLQLVENAFDSVKNLIDIRPIFHWKTKRVKGHIFMCFLSYYLLHKFKTKVAKLLEINTMDTLLTELKLIRKVYFKVGDQVLQKLSNTNELQEAIFKKCKIPVLA